MVALEWILVHFNRQENRAPGWAGPVRAAAKGRVVPRDCSPRAPADLDVQDYRIRFLK